MFRPIKFVKVRENSINYPFIEVIRKDISRIARFENMRWGDNKARGEIYEYEYSALCTAEDKTMCFILLHERDFLEIITSYDVVN